MMTEDAVRAVLLLAGGATPGPWFAVHGLSEEESGVIGGTAPDVIREGLEDNDPECPWRESLVDFMVDADASLIAEGRTLLPLLGHEVLRLRDAMWSARDTLEDANDTNWREVMREVCRALEAACFDHGCEGTGHA